MTKRALWVGLGLAGCVAVSGAAAAEKKEAARRAARR
jgi:hypothetical protein